MDMIKVEIGNGWMYVRLGQRRLIRRLAADLALTRGIEQWSKKAREEISQDLRRREVFAAPFGAMERRQ